MAVGSRRLVGPAMGVVVVSWGLNFAIVKSAFAELPPLAFNGLRFAIAAVLLVLVLHLREGAWRPRRGDLPGLVVLGLLGHAGYQSLFIVGLARTSATHAAVILSMTPLFVGALGVALGLERSTTRMWAGLFIAFVGLFILIVGGGDAGAASEAATPVGDLLTLGASLSWAGYTVLARPYLDRISPLRLTAVTLSLGLPVILATAVPGLIHLDWSGVSLRTWGALAYSSIFAVVISYVIWSISVLAVGSARTAAIANLVPVVAMASAWALLGEVVGPVQILGAAVVLFGVWLARADRANRSPRAPAQV